MCNANKGLSCQRQSFKVIYYYYRAVYDIPYGTRLEACPASALSYPVNGVLSSRMQQSFSFSFSLSLSLSLSLCPYLLSLFLSSRTQYTVTMQLIATVQLPMSSPDVCIDLHLKSEDCGLIWHHISLHYNKRVIYIQSSII